MSLFHAHQRQREKATGIPYAVLGIAENTYFSHLVVIYNKMHFLRAGERCRKEA